MMKIPVFLLASNEKSAPKRRSASGVRVAVRSKRDSYETPGLGPVAVTAWF